MTKLSLRTVAAGYLILLILGPVALVVWNAFGSGILGVWASITQPDALHALVLTLEVAALAVLFNTVWGTACALILARHDFRGKSVLNTLVDLPLSVSPVVVGLALVIVYGQDGWLGGWLSKVDIQIIFSLPGMVLATVFVSLPYVVREVVPLLQEIGIEQEQVASTLGASVWQSFLRITLPSIQRSLAYGVVLATARALGEFGAVSIISGNLEGRTQTMTMYVEDRFQQYDLTGAFSATLVLGLFALAALLISNGLVKRGEAV